MKYVLEKLAFCMMNSIPLGDQSLPWYTQVTEVSNALQARWHYPFHDRGIPSWAWTTDKNFGRANCPVLRRPAIVLWLEIVESSKFMIQEFI
jgi:hypothetical protein